jgi:transcription antitermination factor NusG
MTPAKPFVMQSADFSNLSAAGGPSTHLGSDRWYAVQAQPRRERVALRHLGNQGFATFCPMGWRTKRVGRHSVSSLDPFFPGYVFVSMNLDRQPWRSINGTIGVARIVCLGHARPQPLPEGLVERFEALSDPENGQLKFRENLSQGDAVRVMGGPFDQLCGTLETAGNLERVTILLEVLSKETRVQLGRNLLVAA